MSESMTPERAQECLEVWGDSLGEVTFNDIRSAFRTIVAVGEALDYMEKSYKHKSEIKYSTYGEGYVDGLDIAIRRLEEALGVDVE